MATFEFTRNAALLIVPYHTIVSSRTSICAWSVIKVNNDIDRGRHEEGRERLAAGTERRPHGQRVQNDNRGAFSVPGLELTMVEHTAFSRRSTLVIAG